MDLSIIIVTYNTRELTLNCLGSLAQHPPSGTYETIVVDNASRDGTAEALRQKFPAVRLIESSRNLGFAGGNNLALRESSGRNVLLLNNDTLVRDDAIDQMRQYLDQNPRVGALGCQLLYGDGTFQNSYGPVPNLFGLLVQSLGIRHMVPRGLQVALGRNLRGILVGRTLKSYFRWFSDNPAGTLLPVKLYAGESLYGACLMIRRAALKQVGLLDEGFFMYCEDPDYCLRLSKAGWELYFLPAVRIVHLKGQSAGPDYREVSLEAKKSILYFFAKHRGKAASWAAKTLIHLGILRLALTGFFRRNGALSLRKGWDMLWEIQRYSRTLGCR